MAWPPLAAKEEALALADVPALSSGMSATVIPTEQGHPRPYRFLIARRRPSGRTNDFQRAPRIRKRKPRDGNLAAGE